MWLTQSSIGRKVIMSVTGLALVLFMTFHACMNFVAIFSADAYNWICSALGANWYALVATAGLGALVVAHVVFAFILTIQNHRARGKSRYAVVDKPEIVEWTSQNMFVLGLMVLIGIFIHMAQFWLNMMAAELFNDAQPYFLDKMHSAHDGYNAIVQIFANPLNVALYLLWFLSIWLHLTHGMWSSMQTVGASSKIWFTRIKLIGNVYATVIMLMYTAVALWFGIGYHLGWVAYHTPAVAH